MTATSSYSTRKIIMYGSPERIQNAQRAQQSQGDDVGKGKSAPRDGQMNIRSPMRAQSSLGPNSTRSQQTTNSKHHQSKAVVGGQNMVHSLVAHMPSSRKHQSRDRMEGVLVINGVSERMRRTPAVLKIIPDTRCGDDVVAPSVNTSSKPKRPQSSPSHRVSHVKPRYRPASARPPPTAKINPLLRCNSVESFVQFDIAVPSDQRYIAVHGQDDAFTYLRQQWMDERQANRQDQATTSHQASGSPSHSPSSQRSQRTAGQVTMQSSASVEREQSLESCVELSASELQLSDDCTSCTPGQGAPMPGTPEKQQWRMYRMDVDVAQAPLPAARDWNSSIPAHFDAFAAQPQPIRPYRCNVPARPATARPATARPASATPPAARPASARPDLGRPRSVPASCIDAAVQGPISDVPAPQSAVPHAPRVAAKRPWSAHARMMYTSDAASQGTAHRMVTKEGRASQQAAAGLSDKVEARRPASARARSRCYTGNRASAQQPLGSVVGRSSWSVAATFDTPVCIARTKAGWTGLRITSAY